MSFWRLAAEELWIDGVFFVSFSYFCSHLWPAFLGGCAGCWLLSRKYDGSDRAKWIRLVGGLLVFFAVVMPPSFLFHHILNQIRVVETAVLQFSNESPEDWRETKDFTLIRVGKTGAVMYFPDERYYAIEKNPDGEVVAYYDGKAFMGAKPGDVHVSKK